MRHEQNEDAKRRGPDAAHPSGGASELDRVQAERRRKHAEQLDDESYFDGDDDDDDEPPPAESRAHVVGDVDEEPRASKMQRTSAPPMSGVDALLSSYAAD